MRTIHWDANDGNTGNEMITAAAAMLKAGDTVAFPTETVYGLGADATNPAAVDKIFQAKGRPQDNPLISHVATKEQLLRMVEDVPDYVDKLLDTFSPGPLTYVLKSSGECAENVTAGLDSIGVRIPSHPVAQTLLKLCDIPIAAPSANVSGKPSPTQASHVQKDLDGKIAGILDGGQTGYGVESTVIDCTGDIPVILRPGGVTKEQLEKVVGKVISDPALKNSSEKPKAPGMKYRHYAPEVPLWLVYGSSEKIQGLVDNVKKSGQKVGMLVSNLTAERIHGAEKRCLGDTSAEIAANLYDGLRYFKSGNVDIIIAEAISEVGIGQAIMNRLKKAASKEIHPE